MLTHNLPADGDVAVLVPYRGDGGARDEAWSHARAWWTATYPGWALIEGNPPEGPWCKAAAVGDALQHWAARAQVLVIADADVICPGVERAVTAVAAGARWAKPHRRVHRLTEAATHAVYAGGALPDPSRMVGHAAPHQRRSGPIYDSYAGIAGGGLVALPADRYQQAPLDPRFHGWGQEDTSWGHALTILFGHPWVGTADLYHLWHPPPVRAGRQEPIAGQGTQISRSIGNVDGLELYHRYQAAKTPAAVLAILAEAADYPTG